MSMPVSLFYPALLTILGKIFFCSFTAQAQTPPKDLKPQSTIALQPDNDLLLRSALSTTECPAFSKLSSDYQKRFLVPMRTWAEQHTSTLNAKKIVYPFSGADIVTAASLFQSADHLVLVADQFPEYVRKQIAPPGQAAKECDIMMYFARYGYFRTNELTGKDSVGPSFIKLLTYSIALIDAKVSSINFLVIEKNGATTIYSRIDGIKPDGLRFVVTSPKGREIKVDYVRIDLSNKGVKPGNRFHAFLNGEIDDTVFLKSASHLLQKPYFSNLANLITDKAINVVQDETGLDIEPLRNSFDIRSYGKFHAPHPLWQDSASGQRLVKYLSDQTTVEPLPFVIGYEKKSGSLLLVSSRKPKLN
jgi:hypothetical protein